MTASQTPAQGPNAAALVRADQPSAVVASNEITSDMALTAYAEGRDLERVVAEVVLPVDYQYVIDKKDRETGGRVITKVGITADGYDYLNRALGATFFFPRYVHDQEGREVLNPIHRRDYIYLRMGVVYYTPIGQLVSAIEDIEVDFNLMYQDKRANAWSATPIVDDRGSLLWDEAGNPALKLDPKDELKCLRELTRARAFGPRYAVTVGRVRLLKVATGIRSLPAERAGMATKIKMVSYRDRMTPEQRVAKATDTLADLYGGQHRDDLKPLSDAEAGAVGIVPVPEPDEMEREHVAESIANQQTARPWSDDELADLDEDVV